MIDYLLQLFFFQPGAAPALFFLELTGFITGIASVYLLAMKRLLGWPIGIANCMIYIYVFYHHQFYSDSILYIYFLVMMFVGWWDWTRPASRTSKEGLAVRRLSYRAALAWLYTAIGLTIVWGALMRHWLEAALPYHDAATTIFSFIAQYLMARRYLECWVLWIAVDIVSPLNYLEKGLIPTAVLYGVYLGLAVAGLHRWRESEKEEYLAA